MLWVACVAVAHVPFFSEDSITLQKQKETSQAYYFQQVGQLIADDGADFVEVVSSTRNNPCDISVLCGETAVVVGRAVEAHGETFTQSVYYTLYSATLNCTQRMRVVGDCEHPWAAVVGKDEVFTVGELISFPIYTAKVHGRWWSQQYSLGWFVLLALLYSGYKGFDASLVAVSVAVALWAARAHHATVFAGTLWAALFAATELLMIPVALTVPRLPVLAAVLALVLACAGVGGLLVPWIVVAAAIMPPPRKSSKESRCEI